LVTVGELVTVGLNVGVPVRVGVGLQVGVPVMVEVYVMVEVNWAVEVGVDVETTMGADRGGADLVQPTMTAATRMTASAAYFEFLKRPISSSRVKSCRHSTASS
jgi:hypothetical protein